ncbi:MAG: PfkB family carbohydrate kinase [Rhodobacteraceae bacterium]|nr:PfkB family carbohydrate kinase [Paracoccaceae bacterium]
MTPDILVIGALHLDVIVNAPRFPQPDETIVGTTVSYQLGGKGGNQALAAARMGAAVAMAGRIGNDDFGRRIVQTLEASGVDFGRVRQVDGPSGMSAAVLDTGGDYGAVIVSGVNVGIDPAEIALPPSLKLLLLQSEIPSEVNQAVISRSPVNCRVILNAAPFRAAELNDRRLMERVDILVVNRLEAAQHLGLGKEFDARQAVKRLLGRGPSAAIVTLGADGLVACTREGCFALPGIGVEPVSTHGAGDAFIGALGAELMRAADLRQAAEFAQGAAALAVAGFREGVDRERVLGFLRQQ